MPSSSSSSHYLPALLIIIIILHISSRAYSQEDQNTPFLTHYSDNNLTESSPYESNLRRLISNVVISTPNSPTYFSLNNSRTSPTIYGLAQCRPDISSVTCAACLNNTASTAAKLPPDGCGLKSSGFLRSGNCLLIYSDKNFYTTAQEQLFVSLPAMQEESSVTFSRHVQTLMNTVTAAEAVADLRFGVGFANDSADAVDIFGMGWCSMDLAADDCLQCLSVRLG